MHRLLVLSLATTLSLAAGSMAAHGRSTGTPLLARAVEAPQARAEGAETVDDVVAAAVIGSIGRQFDTNDVTVQLGEMDVVPLSVRDRELQGAGRLRIDGDAQWIPFRFAALYDTEMAEVTYPRLELGGDEATDAVDPRVAQGLRAQVAQALAAEFAGQPVAWTPGVTTMSGGDARFVRVSGTGLADFGAEGRVDAQVDALFDRRTGRWLRVSYELGPSESAMEPGAVASL